VSDDGDQAEGTLKLDQTSSLGQRLSAEVVQSLYSTHATEVFAFLLGVLRDADDARDVSQLTFRRLVEVGHTAAETTIKGWIFKVALREALTYRRQTSRQDRHLKQISLEFGSSSPAGSLEDDLVRREDVTRLKQLLSQLPADQLNVVRQRIYEEKTFSTIANELDVPLGTVLTRMRLALEKLRKWWGRE
jgi:RNA polymerase sigma factor (sigma-70 family)